MWTNFPAKVLQPDPIPKLSHLSLHTGPLIHDDQRKRTTKAPAFGAPTLSLLPPPKKVETLELETSEEGTPARGRLKYNWRRQAFSNPAREDARSRSPGVDEKEKEKSEKGKGRAEDSPNKGLKLQHWTRIPASSAKEDDESEMAEDSEPYPFARYTLEALVYTYTDTEYAELINDPESGWSKEETDYLFDLVKAYGARFYIVQDRYEYQGTTEAPPVKREIEDLKARYYTVARRLILAQAGPDPESTKVAESKVLQHGFDHAQEKARREHVAALWNRTPAQVAEETHLYTELLRLSQTSTTFTAQRHHLLRLLAGIESGLPDIKTRDDRLKPLNDDPQIRGALKIGGPMTAGARGAASRRNRGGQSLDFGESPTYGHSVLSLASASTVRQLLPPAQQAEYDARHHIHRAPPGSTLINPKNTHTPVHARSSKFPTPKASLATYIQTINAAAAAADASGSAGSSVQSKVAENLFAKIDVPTNKLAMPTKDGIELMDSIFHLANQYLEHQRTAERLDAELAIQRQRLGLPPGGDGKEDAGTKDEPMQGVVTSASQGEGGPSTSSATEPKPGESSRKRSMSASSSGTASTTRKRMKA